MEKTGRQIYEPNICRYAVFLLEKNFSELKGKIKIYVLCGEKSNDSITGFEDAFATMYISKRSWNPEKDNQIRETVANYVDRNGKPDKDVKKEVKEEFERMLEMALRMGKKHITILHILEQLI